MAFTDNFNRANADLEASATASGGGNWVHDGLVAAGLQITSNVLRGNTTNGTGTAYKTPNQGSADHYVQYKVNVLATSGPFCCCRLLDRNTFIGVRNDGSTVEVYRRVSGTLTSLSTGGSTVAIGDILRLEVSGNNYTLKKNGTAVVTAGAIGATLTSTDTGIVARSSTGSFFDDFEAGPLASGISVTLTTPTALAVSTTTPVVSIGTTFNPADRKDTTVVLSNGNRTATITGASNPYWVRSTSSKTSGKLYVEYTIGAMGNQAVGIADATTLTYLGSNLKSFGNFSDGNIALNNSFQNWGTTFTTGDVVGMAVDLTAKRLWFRKNGGNWNGLAIGSANPAAGIGHYDLAAYTGSPSFIAISGDTNSVVTVNFGNAAFGTAAPSGFLSWDGVAVNATATITGVTGLTASGGSVSVTAGAILFADNFNRADGWLEESPCKTSSGGWDWVWDNSLTHGGSVFNNILYSGTADSGGAAYKTPPLSSADHYIQYKVPSGLVGILSQGSQSMVACRLQNSGNFVGLNVGNKGGGNGQIEVFRCVAGVYTSLYLSAAATVALNDVLRLECVGSNWTLKKNGTLVSSGAIGATLTNIGTGVVFRSLVAEVAEDFETGIIPPAGVSVNVTGNQLTVSGGSATVGAVGNISASPPGNQVTVSRGTVTVSAVAPFFFDDFNRADENLDANANWTLTGGGNLVGAAAIRSNKLSSLASTGQVNGYRCPDQGNADHYVEYRVENITAGGGPFACCRLADTDNFVGVRNAGTLLEVIRRVGGAFTTVHSSTVVAIVIGTVIRLECVGTNWTVKRDGIRISTGAIGATLTSTRQGVVARSVVNDPWIDNFKAGLVDTSTPPVIDSFSDNFNRADATLESSPVSSSGHRWAWDGVLSTLSIQSNLLYSTHIDEGGSAYKTPSVGSADHFIEFTAPSASTTYGPAISCRMLDRGNFIAICHGAIPGLGNGWVEVWKGVAGVLSRNYTIGPDFIVDNDKLRLSVIGTDFYLFKNNSFFAKGAINAATLTDVGTGIIGGGAVGPHYDNFAAGKQFITEQAGTGLSATVSGGSVTVTAEIGVTKAFPTGQQLGVSVGNVRTGLVVSTTGNQVTVSTQTVTVFEGFGVKPLVTGHQVAVSGGSVTTYNEIGVLVEVTAPALEVSVRTGTVSHRYAYRFSITGTQAVVSVGQAKYHSPDFAWDKVTDIPDNSLSNNNKVLTAIAPGSAYARSYKYHGTIYGFFQIDFGNFYAEVTFGGGGPPSGRVGLTWMTVDGYKTYLELHTGNIVREYGNLILYVRMFPPIQSGDNIGIWLEPYTEVLKFRLNGGPWNNGVVLPWTPMITFYGPWAWIEADKTPFANTAVAKGIDSSGNSFPSGYRQIVNGPVVRTGRLNLPVFDFNNSPVRTITGEEDQVFSSSSLSFGVVLRGGASGTAGRIIDHSPEANGFFVETRNNGTLIGSGSRVAAGAGQYVPYDKTQWTIYSTEKFDTVKSTAINGTVIQTDTIATGGGTTVNPVTIGARNIDATLPLLNTEIAEIVVNNTRVDRQVQEGYLAHKWGLTGLLPANHPYKTTKPTGEILVGDLDFNIFADISNPTFNVTATLNTGDTPFVHPKPTNFTQDWASDDPRLLFYYYPSDPGFLLTTSVGSVTVNVVFNVVPVSVAVTGPAARVVSVGNESVRSSNKVYLQNGIDSFELTVSVGNISTRNDRVTVTGHRLTVSRGTIIASRPKTATPSVATPQKVVTVGTVTVKLGMKVNLIPFSPIGSVRVFSGSVTVKMGAGARLQPSSRLTVFNTGLSNVTVVGKSRTTLTTATQLTVSAGNAVGSIKMFVNVTAPPPLTARSAVANAITFITHNRLQVDGFELTVEAGQIYSNVWGIVAPFAVEGWTRIEGHA